jgi:hypothetical protein
MTLCMQAIVLYPDLLKTLHKGLNSLLSIQIILHFLCAKIIKNLNKNHFFLPNKPIIMINNT